MIPEWLPWLVIGAAIFSIVGLAFTIAGTVAFGPRRRFARPGGSEWSGVRYALGAGMMPWAKESARRHLPTFAAGVVYHLGLAAGFVVLIAAGSGAALPDAWRVALLMSIAAGALAGAALLAKRAATPSLRAISTPDDVVASVLVTAFLIAAAVALIDSRFTASFLGVSVVLLLYIPLGKIRHCFLFFCSRFTFGRFFGRRGILPQQASGFGETHGRI